MSPSPLHPLQDTPAPVRTTLPVPVGLGPVGALSRANAPSQGVACRLGDSSCSSAHASVVARQRAAGSSVLQRSVLHLQRQFGNQHVTRVLRAAAEGDGSSLDAVEHGIGAARGSGNGMDHGTRAQMERAFGADFSGVRIHVDARADDMSQAIGARAFATGKDVFFRQGEYNPGSSSGRELLAHELTHVVQQTGDGVHAKMTVSQPSDPLEVEAEHTARAVIAAEHAPAPPADDTDEERRKHAH